MPSMTFGQMREEAKSQGFEPLPIGTYNFRVTNIQYKPAKNQVSLKVTIMDGPLAGKGTIETLSPRKNDGDVNGFFFAQLKAMGIGDEHQVWQQLDGVPEEQAVQMIIPYLENAMFVAEVTHRNHNGNTYDNLKSYKPYGSPVAGPTGPGGVPQLGQVPQVPVPQAPPVAPAAPPAAMAPTPAQPLQPVAPVPAPAPEQQQQYVDPVTQAPQPAQAPVQIPQPPQAPPGSPF